MIVRTEPLRQLNRLAQQPTGPAATHQHPAPMPMDAYRAGETVFLDFDLPGMDPGSLSLHVERNVLTVAGERKAEAPEHCSYLAAERFSGAFSRQVFLGEALDSDRIEASYDAGVLSVRIPVAAKAKPRRVEITAGS